MQEKTNIRAEYADRSSSRTNPQATAALLEVLLCYGAEGFACIGRDFRFIQVNDQMAEFDGIPVERHVGMPAREIFNPGQWPLRERMLKRAFAGEESVGVMLTEIATHKHGGPRSLRACYYPVRVNGDIIGAAVLYEDDTEKVEGEAALGVSELRKSAILDASLDCIVAMDDAGRIVDFNPAAVRTFGYTREEAVGQQVGDLLVPPAYRKKHFEGLERYLRTGEGTILGRRVELRAQRKDGSEFPAELTIIVIRLRNRPFFTAYLRDITDRVQAARSLAQRESQLSAIFEGALDAILIADDRMRYMDANPAACALFGLSKEELIGRQVTEFVTTPQGESAGTLWQEFEDTGRQSGEVVLNLRDGSSRIVEYSATRDFLPGLHLSILRDVTDRKRAEREVLAANEASLAMAARQREFLTDVLASVTEGKLHLCAGQEDLPLPQPYASDPIALSEKSGLSELRHRVQAAAKENQYSEERSDDLALAVSEVAANAIKHGGGGMGAVHAAPGEPVQVWVADTGRGIAVENLPKATLARGYTTADTLGHGLKIALQTIDRMWLLTGPTGTTIVLEQDQAPHRPLWA